jgi:phosphate transport system ATP-binding protein
VKVVLPRRILHRHQQGDPSHRPRRRARRRRSSSRARPFYAPDIAKSLFDEVMRCPINIMVPQRQASTRGDAPDPVRDRPRVARARPGRQLRGRRHAAECFAGAADEKRKGDTTNERNVQIRSQNVNLYYGPAKCSRISRRHLRHTVTALIGPSGCGKSSWLRCLNRMTTTSRARGRRGDPHRRAWTYYARDTDVIALRRNVAWSSRKPNSLSDVDLRPTSPTAPGCTESGLANSSTESVERSLRGAALWAECQGQAHLLGNRARPRTATATLHRPGHRDGTEILLMDEPTSALDPMATRPHRGTRPRSKEELRWSSSRTTSSRPRASRTSPLSSFGRTCRI